MSFLLENPKKGVLSEIVFIYHTNTFKGSSFSISVLSAQMWL